MLTKGGGHDERGTGRGAECPGRQGQLCWAGRLNQFMNGPGTDRDGWIGTSGQAPAAKVEQSSSFETPLACPERERASRISEVRNVKSETRDVRRETRAENRQSGIELRLLRQDAPVLPCPYRRSTGLDGCGKKNMLPAVGEPEKGATD